MTCASITTTYGITIAQFEAMLGWNPILGSSCQLLSGFAFCIETNFGGETSSSSATTLVTVSTPTTTTTTTTTTSPGNGISTPTPYQAGMTVSCNSFRLIVTNDQCGSIATEAGVSLSDFYLWNPAIGSSCRSLWAGYYVCVGIIGGSTPTKSSAPSTTFPGNGVSTPTPIQPGMTTSCGAFPLVQANEQCGVIATSAGINLKEFYAWNPSVGSTCSTLFAGSYVCVGLAPCAAILPLPSGHYCGRVGTPVAAASFLFKERNVIYDMEQAHFLLTEILDLTHTTKLYAFHVPRQRLAHWTRLQQLTAAELESQWQHQTLEPLLHTIQAALMFIVCCLLLFDASSMANRALELLDLDTPAMILDIGCGSGLSGEIVSSVEEEYGGQHIWVGMDISASMLDIALQRDVEGDLNIGMGGCLGIRYGGRDELH
ncbi:hypothetical protein V495_00205 [Pseudogymnoascus sp. VKM F-4514 (FW-929)]|nr:hypothetical protein V495_00205 [Pseudogymnoascus sp. VKM F-4514 (FW-929)]KFY67323.1 hypothetical protein V497_00436 [Pseudogymnoascus sp. VKM F-4516 (FW-969)]